MADPLSIAAAATGFLSLSGQLMDGIGKLCRFYNASRNALQEVSKLIASMQDLQMALDMLARQLGSLNNTNNSNAIDMQCLHALLLRCQTFQKNIVAKLDAIDRRLRRHRLCQVELPFRKEEIKDALDDIERCKTTLLIALQSFGIHSSHGFQLQLTQHDEQAGQRQNQMEQNL